jgi:anti-anti-sigma factor
MSSDLPMGQIGHETRQMDGHTVLGLAGELDISTSGQLSDAIRSAATDAPRLVIDLSDVTFFDSSATRSLAAAVREVLDTGRQVSVVSPRERRSVRRVLDFVGLATLLPVHDDLATALADTSPAP